MSTYKLILSEFGLENVKAKLYRPGQPLEMKAGNYPAQPEKGRQQVGTSLLGTPVFSDLEIYSSAENPEELIRSKGTAIDVALYTVTQTKNIITTAIQGRNGTVKEYISDGDYQINIKGALVSNDGFYPEAQVQRLIRICQVPAAVPVGSWFLRQFGIYNLVIESYNLAQNSGKENIQIFELNCLSDTPIELMKSDE